MPLEVRYHEQMRKHMVEHEARRLIDGENQTKNESSSFAMSWRFLQCMMLTLVAWKNCRYKWQSLACRKEKSKLWFPTSKSIPSILADRNLVLLLIVSLSFWSWKQLRDTVAFGLIERCGSYDEPECLLQMAGGFQNKRILLPPRIQTLHSWWT